MIRRRILAAAAIGAIGVFGATIGARGVAASGPTLTQLTGDVLPYLMGAGVTDHGSITASSTPADLSTPVEIDLTLADSNASQEAALLASVDAGTHPYLTPQQVAEQFGSDPGDFEAALSFATSKGLSVVRTSSARDLIVLSGTAQQAENTFGVTIDNFTDTAASPNVSFYANTEEPWVPAGLGITGVIGLNSAQKMTLDQSDCEPAVSGSECLGITTPEDMWSTYDMPSNDEGQGQKVAIFGEGDWTPPLQDLRDFESDPDQLTSCGPGTTATCSDALPQVPVRVVEVDGTQAQYTDTAGDEEWDIDTQASTGMAPDVEELDLYFGTNLSDADVLNVGSDWADDPNGPLQASASYGECEYDPAAPYVDPTDDFAAGGPFTVAYEQAMTHANLEGRQLFSSAGDDGSSCPVTPVDTNGVLTQAFPDVNYPCSSPEVICVGGTTLYTKGTNPNSRYLENAWDDSGGGTSAIFAAPSWQSGAQPDVFPCVYNDQGTPYGTSAPSCRGVPDIAAQSGDIVTNGYDIYNNGTPTEQGGTSLSSPLSLGMWARIQAASTKTLANGPAGPVLYGQAAAGTATENTSKFFDVGNSAAYPDTPNPPETTPSSNGYFETAPGWDYVTGLGVMDVKNLATAIDGTTTPSNDTLPNNPDTITYYDGTDYAVIPSSGPVDPACVPLFTGSPTGSTSYPLGAGMDYPYLDIIQGDMHNTPSTLTTILTVKDLEQYTAQATDPTAGYPATLEEYYFLWDFGGTDYYTNLQLSASGASFSYGTYTAGTPNTYNQVATLTTGVSATYGPDGTITVTLPLSDIGSPLVGATPSTLTSPHAEADVFEGTSVTGGAGYVADTAGPQYDYTLDEICAATGLPGSDGGSTSPSSSTPEVPLPALLPLVGFAVAGTLSYRRRRRTLKPLG